MALSSTVEKDIAIACICSALILSRCAYRIYHRYRGNGGSHRIWHADDIYMALALLPLTSRTVCIALSFTLNPSSSRLPVTKEEAAAQNTTVEKLEHDRTVGISLLIGTRSSYTLMMWKLASKENQPVCQKGIVYFFALAAGNISTDIALLILPFPTLSMARLNTRTKIQLGILFSIGILVITITIVRVPLILGDAMSQKARSTWATIEILCGCIVANTPFFYGILRELGQHKGTQPSASDPSRSEGPFYLQSKGADHRCYELQPANSDAAHSDAANSDGNNNSQELIIVP
ncbi:uncharacterized protein FTJAE_9379 [Fusarium tjaetaba]|uniref:Rhodopsin domain-containing protein n=1 Tax=Fusarium tjaetaba TaxID=1567544 RepID=A0A8H5R5X6_9HYPO|nr:uncharacterized protein FTJAE_9379 [Fusarium tjaetaba]KAF5627294.1 hypothetical protein FTJAE_9379 [Fusarium tjaetaba]